MSAAASPTSPKPSMLSSSVLTGRDSRGRWCGSRPASATSAAKIPTTSLPIWRITMDSQKSWTNRCQVITYPAFCIQFFWCMIMYKGHRLYGLFPIGKICKYETCLQNGFLKHDGPLKNIYEELLCTWKTFHPVSVKYWRLNLFYVAYGICNNTCKVLSQTNIVYL